MRSGPCIFWREVSTFLSTKSTPARYAWWGLLSYVVCLAMAPIRLVIDIGGILRGRR